MVSFRAPLCGYVEAATPLVVAIVQEHTDFTFTKGPYATEGQTKNCYKSGPHHKGLNALKGKRVELELEFSSAVCPRRVKCTGLAVRNCATILHGRSDD